MKKLILSVAGTSLLALSSSAQGIAFADNSGASYDTTIAGTPNTTKDLNLELLYGTSAGSVTTPVVTLLLSTSATPASTPIAIGGTYAALSDISFLGTIADPSGVTYSLPGGVTDFFQVLAWSGSYQSYAAALASGVTGEFAGTSSVFSESIPASSTAFPADISSVGVVGLTQVPTTIIPEPSTLAMAGVGLASMLFMRRKIS
jgi:hypothetical protein